MKACFIGLGYIGLPTAIIAAGRGGADVVGVDINPAVVEKTNAGHLHFIEPEWRISCVRLWRAANCVRRSRQEEADAFFIVVPTPFKGDHQPDISFVEAATRAVVPFLREGNLFVIESTSPVGTTEAMAELIYGMRPNFGVKSI